ncbi:hypothetical protein [Allorhodopirellula solitaria]|uniref:Uncharacterized protein n=1 Tax=Allorhodopirellula solitaria TaxID=2527987 RepID=A0A5C5YBY0_9BACT|nr:hypothetical protein [Allorhodopirellula solitaria]TWT72890.1 hypothetical protein CA85_13510 [Allorhodopirellula solitaria]
MTLARKRSSPIHVDGIDYRWAVSARTLSSPEYVLLVVQSVDNGQRIVVTVPHRDRYLNMGGPPPPDFHYDAITPSLVRTIMAAAVDAGWVPDRPGSELSFELQPDETVRLR